MGILGATYSNGLTTMQMKFCNHYLANGHKANLAAETAGYKSKALNKGDQVLKHPLVQKYLANRIKQLQKNVEVTVDWKMGKLVNITERTEDGKPQVAISAISELNKMQGHYAPTQVQQTNLNLDLDVLKLKEINDLVNEKQKDY
jgi:phage terminase small subunit